MPIELIVADRDEREPVRYFPGQPNDHLAVYPLPHLIDAFARYGQEIEDRYLERCRIMLRAGLVPDSIGKPGSPVVGIRTDHELAGWLLARLGEG